MPFPGPLAAESRFLFEALFEQPLGVSKLLASPVPSLGIYETKRNSPPCRSLGLEIPHWSSFFFSLLETFCVFSRTVLYIRPRAFVVLCGRNSKNHIQFTFLEVESLLPCKSSLCILTTDS